MKVMLVGGGGREHAIAWSLARRHPSIEIVAAPGNPGIAQLGRCVPIAVTELSKLLDLARVESPALVIVGPEAPLAAGIVDVFRGDGIPTFGPTRAAARIESSKAFSKQLMRDAGVPTARAERHTTIDGAMLAIRTFGAPVVIKASGLAAGKGVSVCATTEDADRAAVAMLSGRAFGDAGAEILVEEFMEGEELSLFVITDGTTAIPMLPAQDHKRLLDGDRGPNTGGMGAYAPVSIGSESVIAETMERVITPTLAALRVRGTPFTGLLYAGLMLGERGPRVVEFNARFGDPETEAILPLLESDLLAPMLAVARGEPIAGATLQWKDAHAVTTVVAAAGYPESPRTGVAITLPPPAPDVTIFHAGTAKNSEGMLTVGGGRVFAVTGTGNTLVAAQHASAQAAAAIQFEGRQFRTDIGWRELFRHARAPGD